MPIGISRKWQGKADVQRSASSIPTFTQISSLIPLMPWSNRFPILLFAACPPPLPPPLFPRWLCVWLQHPNTSSHLTSRCLARDGKGSLPRKGELCFVLYGLRGRMRRYWKAHVCHSRCWHGSPIHHAAHSWCLCRQRQPSLLLKNAWAFFFKTVIPPPPPPPPPPHPLKKYCYWEALFFFGWSRCCHCSLIHQISDPCSSLSCLGIWELDRDIYYRRELVLLRVCVRNEYVLCWLVFTIDVVQYIRQRLVALLLEQHGSSL